MCSNSRQAFMQAIQELMATRSFDSITVAELSRIAGYSRKTFYQNFIDIYDLVQQILLDDLTTTAQECGFKDYHSFVHKIAPVLQDEDASGIYDGFLSNLESVFYNKRLFYAKAFAIDGPNSLRSRFRDNSFKQCYEYIKYTAEKLGVRLTAREMNEIAEYHAAAITDMIGVFIQRLVTDPNADRKIFRGESARRSYKFVYAYIWYLSNHRDT